MPAPALVRSEGGVPALSRLLHSLSAPFTRVRGQVLLSAMSQGLDGELACYLRVPDVTVTSVESPSEALGSSLSELVWFVAEGRGGCSRGGGACSC